MAYGSTTHCSNAYLFNHCYNFTTYHFGCVIILELEDPIGIHSCWIQGCCLIFLPVIQQIDYLDCRQAGQGHVLCLQTKTVVSRTELILIMCFHENKCLGKIFKKCLCVNGSITHMQPATPAFITQALLFPNITTAAGFCTFHPFGPLAQTKENTQFLGHLGWMSTMYTVQSNSL